MKYEKPEIEIMELGELIKTDLTFGSEHDYDYQTEGTSPASLE